MTDLEKATIEALSAGYELDAALGAAWDLCVASIRQSDNSLQWDTAFALAMNAKNRWNRAEKELKIVAKSALADTAEETRCHCPGCVRDRERLRGGTENIQ